MKDSATTINYQDLIAHTIKTKLSSFLLGLFIVVLVIALSTAGLSVLSRTLRHSSPKVASKPKTMTKKSVRITYTIKEGDDLSKISQQVYGTDAYANDIAKANNIFDPNLLNAGVVLLIPAITPQPTQTATGSGQIDSGAAFDSVHTSP